ncbi:MAG: TonB-dependent receptor, partial [Acidobacteriota bacterium]|nr:TonB-dependent receptor [Acidobacteriota bacterium]
MPRLLCCPRLLALWMAVAVLAVPARLRAQAPSAPGGQLEVLVRDPSGAVIVGAAVTVTAAGGARREGKTGPNGEATFEGLAPGRYDVRATADGFEPRAENGVRVRQGRTRREVTLKIAALSEQVTVGRNPREAASDARGGFETVLGPDQIAQLPDDPDEMAQQLKNMAGPGAVLRVNGFRGGRLPPKNEIQEIRFHRNFFAADNHEPSFVSVDIITRPGFGAWSGGVNTGIRSTTLDARNAFSPTKGSGRFDRYGLNVSGPLWKQHTSASLAVDGISSYESQTILAALPEGTYAAPIRQPSDRVNVDARLQQALSKTHALRFEYQRNHEDDQDLGVGGFNLADRGYGRTTTDQYVRLSDTGPFGDHLYNDARLQYHDQEMTTTPVSTAPAAMVLNAFNSGGAQQQGATRTREWEFADDLDITAGRHALRAGTLIQAGRYDNAVAQNADGTFTFSSLAAFLAGAPTTFTQRLGNPAVSYSQVQAGVYLQDDIRITQSFTVSAGIREEWQSHVNGLHAAPRGGITWAPTRDGRTTIRAGGGVFYDWYTADTYAQTLQVNGTRQTDLVVQQPGYPDPFAGGLAVTVPPGLIRQAALSQPEIVEGLIGVQRQFEDGVNVNA